MGDAVARHHQLCWTVSGLTCIVCNLLSGFQLCTNRALSKGILGAAGLTPCCGAGNAGARTGLSGFVTGCVVGLVLLVMTPVFEKLPLNVMGAIVVGRMHASN